MNKQEWLNRKNKHEYTPEMLWEFWKSNKKPEYKELTLEEFTQEIERYINSNGYISSDKLIKYFDNVFFVTKTYDKNSNLIKET